MKVERRAISGLSAQGNILSALAIPYNSRSQDMGFIEQIAPDAFKESLQGDIKALYEHERQHIIGRTQSGTLRLNNTLDGVYAEIDLPNTSIGNDLAVLVGRGDISGMSFGFIVDSDSWDYSQEPALRTILKATLTEVTVTSDPAYLQTHVTVSQRALNKAKIKAVNENLRAEIELLEVI